MRKNTPSKKSPYQLQEEARKAAGISMYDPLLSIKPQVSESTKVITTKPKPVVSQKTTPLNDLEKQKQQANFLVQQGKAARYLGDKYNNQKDDPKSLNELMLREIQKNPNIQKDIDANEYKLFLERDKKSRDKQNLGYTIANNTSAFLADPIATGANWMKGKGALMDQGTVLHDPTNSEYKNYLKATEGDSYLNQGTNIFNPGAWAADAKVANQQGDYLGAAINLADAFAVGKANSVIGNTQKSLLTKNGKKVKAVDDVISSHNFDNVQQAGMVNPFKLLDTVVPRLNPASFADGMGSMFLSPLNAMPGYGKYLEKDRNKLFRKFGSDLSDVQKRKVLSPTGGATPRMGKKQITSEGNWAARGEVNESYPGVFEATVDLKHPNTNLNARKISNRAGELIVDKAGNNIIDIPITDEGLSFNRRLPFSHRYVPINKEKLLENKFQVATIAPHLQSLAEKYALGLGYAGAGAIMTGSSDPIKTYNDYTINPIIDQIKEKYNTITNSSLKENNTKKTATNFKNGGNQ